ncbi:hypothetical protein SEUCBS139899_002850 [Sporothrix eucalyptigena]|uniref:Aminotransferase class V domain-containing protein n=1 Tax=Sporothrix eucalyptigena TaxID=1812306 RepID=A0ABP0BYX5_9PEZI
MVHSHAADFPGLANKQIFFDNAGGTQVVRGVTEAIVDYLTNTNAQIGASYPVSLASQKIIEDAWSSAAKYINAGRDEVMLGASSTQLLRNLATSLHEHIQPGDEIVVSSIDHEANMAPWIQLAQDRGATVVWYKPTENKNPRVEAETLRTLLTSKTKLVACTQVSNVLGSIHDAKALADVVHTIPGALFCLDGVAFAPHRAVDVTAWGVDFYAFSWYKVYGPHISTLYASREAQKVLRIIGHPYKQPNSLENILGVAGANYELGAAIPVVCKYLSAESGWSWDAVAAHEERLQAILINYLLSKETVQIWGEPVADRARRVPVISFTVRNHSSKDIVDRIQAQSNFGCKWGSFLSIRLCEDYLGLDMNDGVVRVSLAHYNTEEEVTEYTRILDGIIG